MSGRSSFRHRLVQCPRCRRQLGAECSVCPHCDHRRVSKLARVRRTPMRAALVIVLALLAIGGYVYLGEPGFAARTFISR